jgi:hypothetical protein
MNIERSIFSLFRAGGVSYEVSGFRLNVRESEKAPLWRRYFVIIEYLRFSFVFKKGGAKRHQQIFNLQSSIFNSGLSGLGV